MRTVVRNMMQDTIWVMVLQGLNYLIPLFVWPYLMTVLGSEGFGKIGFSLQLMQFMMLMTDFGFNLSATKQIATAGTREAIDRIATDTLCAKLLLFAFCTVMTVLLLLLPQYTPYRPIVWVMFPMLLGNLFSFQWLFQGLGKIRQVSIITGICRLLILPITFWLVKSQEDVLRAGMILASTYVLSGIAMSVWVVKGSVFRFVPTSCRRVKNALCRSLPLFVSTATSSIYAVLFVVILGYFVSPSEVGCYSAVEKIMRVSCYLFLLPVLQVFYPSVSRMNSVNPGEARRLVRMVLAGMTVMMAGIGAVLFFGGDYVISLLGKDYAGSTRLFHIMAFIPVMIAMSGVCGQLGLVAMGGERQQRQFRNVYVAGAVVSLVSVVALSPILNAQWAALCLLMAEGIVGAGMYFYYRRI